MDTAYDSILTLIQKKREASSRFPYIVALDGPCASGKTTAAARISEALDCPVVHMDDFFLRPEQRTPDRLATPGENIDHERFLEEVLIPLTCGKPCRYAPFSCTTQSLLPPVDLMHDGLVLIEGSYSHHPALRPYCDLFLFLTVTPEKQLDRIRKRNGEAMAKVFQNRWIPLEEAYFSAFSVSEHADGIFSLN